MTLVSSILYDAYRETNMVALGRALNANQSTEALRLLNALFSGIYGTDAGEYFQDWPLGNFSREEPQYQPIFTERQIDRPTINKRLIATNEEAKRVYLTPYPQDGSRMAIADPFGRLATVPVTLDGNGRTIDGAPEIVLNTDGTFAEWLYRADLGQWVRITDKAETDEMPFPQQFDNMFIILLAMRLSPRYGRSLDDQSALIIKQQRRDFVARYLQSAPLEIDDSISWPFMSRQGYDLDRQFTSTQQEFRSGFWRPW